MSIQITRGNSGTIVYVDIPDEVAFKEMVQRAINTWQEPPENIRLFVDKLLDHRHWPPSPNVAKEYKATPLMPKTKSA